MLAKCTNPSCSVSFLRLAGGRLFRLETESRFQSSNGKETEYFWLCEVCSTKTTLRLAPDGTVATIGLADALCDGPHIALNSLDRENGLFLRSVSSLPRRRPTVT